MDAAHAVFESLPDGFHALVVGATGGIGSAFCDLLERQPRLGALVRVSRSGSGFDLLNEDSIAEQAASLSQRKFHLMICATGVLTTDGRAPEKALRQLDPETMAMQFRVNAIGPALVMKHFLPLLDRQQRSIAAFLSARVGSIGDNRLGGWYAYRASKAALNQFVRTASIELARTHPQAVLVSVHPGTVRTSLSGPYSAGHNTVSAAEAALSISGALEALTPEKTGSFIAYDGKDVPW